MTIASTMLATYYALTGRHWSTWRVAKWIVLAFALTM